MQGSSTVIQRGKEAPPVEQERVCKGCFHFAVCGIARSLIPALKSAPEEPASPINGQDLAKICTAYLAIGAVLTA